MSYVMIDSGSLSGLAGPMKVIIEHGDVVGLGVSEGPTSGEAAVGQADVVNGLNQLLAVARTETAKVVENVGFLSRGAAQNWADSIVNTISSVKGTLTAGSPPFFARHPEDAARLLKSTGLGLRADIADFQQQSSSLVGASMGDMFDQIITGVVQGLVKVADKSIREAVKAAGNLPTLPGGVPGWVVPAVALVALMAAWRATR